MKAATVMLRALRHSAQTAGELTLRDTEIDSPGGRIRLGLDASGLPILCIPIPLHESDVEDHSSQGFRLDTIDGEFLDSSDRIAILRCTSPLVQSPFVSLCDEILQDIQVSPEFPVAGLLGVLARWRHLMAPTYNPEMTDPQLMGLLAELHVLEALVEAVGATSAAELWTGPTGARHDYMSQRCSLEVKATSTRDQFAISINGIHQLEPSGHGPLYLYAEQMERNPSADSVTDATDRLLARGVDAVWLLTNLAKVGFNWQQSEEYREVRFSTLDSRFYEVDGNFPRIVPSAFLAQTPLAHITRVEYQIDLGPLHSHGVDSLGSAIEELRQ